MLSNRHTRDGLQGGITTSELKSGLDLVEAAAEEPVAAAAEEVWVVQLTRRAGGP